MSGPLLFILRILLAACLYIFLGWALYTLWRDLKHQSELSAAHAPSMKLSSPDGALNYRFIKPEVNIGRDPANEVFLTDKTVSTQHARLIYRQNQWWLEDLRSTNGTFLNQEPVSTPLVVTSGDQMRCGQVVLNIKIGE